MPPKTKKDLSNHEIVTLAVYLLGGDARRIDTEHIAKKANELAPGRFTWRKYSDQINIELIRAFLSDAKKPKNGKYLVGSGNEGWLITDAGLIFVKNYLPGMKGLDLSRKALSQKDRNWMRRERDRMLSSDACQKFSAGQSEQITPQDAEAFFRLDAYVTGKPREEKILRTKNLFGTDPELGPLIKTTEEKLPIRGEQ
jgi:hypothetical protein